MVEATATAFGRAVTGYGQMNKEELDAIGDFMVQKMQRNNACYLCLYQFMISQPETVPDSCHIQETIATILYMYSILKYIFKYVTLYQGIYIYLKMFSKYVTFKSIWPI